MLSRRVDQPEAAMRGLFTMNACHLFHLGAYAIAIMPPHFSLQLKSCSPHPSGCERLSVAPGSFLTTIIDLISSGSDSSDEMAQHTAPVLGRPSFE